MEDLMRKIGAPTITITHMAPPPHLASAQAPGQQAAAQDASAQQVSNTPQAGFVLKMNGELVLTNVVARDAKTGEVVKGLKQSDFTISESGKPQKIETLDFESV